MPATRASTKFVECQICGRRNLQMLSVHLGAAHNMTVAEYNSKFPGSPTVGAEAGDSMESGQEKRWRNRTAQIAAEAQQTTESEPEPEEMKPGDELTIGGTKIRIRNLSEEDAKLVPTHDPYYEIDDEIMCALTVAFKEDHNVLLVGPTGCGKSSAVFEMCAIVNWPLRKANLHGELRVKDLVGEKVLKTDPVTGQSIVFYEDGLVQFTMERGAGLLLEELDAAPPETHFALHGVLEPDRQLVLTRDAGRIVEADPYFRVIATANTIGKGDDTGLYTGTNVLNEAFLDRFGIVIECDYPSQEKEVRIAASKGGVTSAVAETMVDVARLVRAGFKSEDCYCTFSTRRVINWASMATALGIEQAAKVTILNKLSKDDREYVGGVMQRIMGGSGWQS